MTTTPRRAAAHAAVHRSHGADRRPDHPGAATDHNGILRPDADPGADVVILLDPAGHPTGLADRRTVHTDSTPLHLAFSAYLFDDDGRLLLTRRALDKVAWPGVWTNSCCGHPRPGESMGAAIARRVRDELGARVTDIRPLLPDFAYRAVDASGIVENEKCPVYAARLTSALTPNPSEVADLAWAEPAQYAAAVRAAPFAFSPWSVAQIDQLTQAEPQRWGA